MKKKYELGYSFNTSFDWSFKGFLIPKGTECQITEVDLEGEEGEEFKVYFNVKTNPEHEECIQILDFKEVYSLEYGIENL